MRYPELQAREIEPQPLVEDLPKSYPKGRRCFDCDRRLSMWNPGPKCHACNPSDLELEEALEDILSQPPTPSWL